MFQHESLSSTRASLIHTRSSDAAFLKTSEIQGDVAGDRVNAKTHRDGDGEAAKTQFVKLNNQTELLKLETTKNVTTRKRRKRIYETKFKYSQAASVINPNLPQDTTMSPPNEVGSLENGGTFNGTHTKTIKQVYLPKRLFFTKVLPAGIPRYNKMKRVVYNPWTANIWAIFNVIMSRGFKLHINETTMVALQITRGEIPHGIDDRRQLINSIGKSDCLAGNKGQQLWCRRDFVDLQGCDFDDLDISPMQYNMFEDGECDKFFSMADLPHRKNKMFLAKPILSEHGDGIRIFHGTARLKEEFGMDCSKKKPFIIMDYVSNPALVNGRKADLRTFILVASLKPKLVFYHEGYSRLTSENYTTNSSDPVIHITNSRNQSMFQGRFLNHTQLALKLRDQHNFDAERFKNYVRKRAKAVSRFVFEAALTEVRHIQGRFQLYAMDWSIDENGKLGLLEVNAAPLIASFPWIGLTPKIWEDFFDLVLLIQTRPNQINGTLTVKDGFRYEGWELIFNELEAWYEKAHGRAYNACTVFLNKDEWKVDF